MIRVRALAPLVVVALLAGVGTTASEPARSAARPAVLSAALSAARCHGVGYGDVRGQAPALARPPLAKYPAATAVCAAYWLPQVDRWFVPQSLEVDGTTAYIGGYRWHLELGQRPCQIAVLDTRTGRVRAFVTRIQAPVYRPTPTYCRHAGGMELTREGLWVAEFERLWLLDPAKLGKADPVLRVWRLAAPVRAGAMVVVGNRLGLGDYVRNGPGKVWWFDLDDVLAPGRTLLDRRVATRPAPQRLQGLTAGAGGGLWFSSSSTHCGELKAPGRPAVAFVPGAEDIELVGPDLWTLSESGAKPYLDADERVVPTLLRLDRRQVLAGTTARCGW